MRARCVTGLAHACANCGSGGVCALTEHTQTRVTSNTPGPYEAIHGHTWSYMAHMRTYMVICGPYGHIQLYMALKTPYVSIHGYIWSHVSHMPHTCPTRVPVLPEGPGCCRQLHFSSFGANCGCRAGGGNPWGGPVSFTCVWGHMSVCCRHDRGTAGWGAGVKPWRGQSRGRV